MSYTEEKILEDQKRDLIAEMHEITCPYCLVGSAPFIVEKSGDGTNAVLKNLNIPRKCSKCKREFYFKPVTKIIGVKIEDRINV